MVHAGVLAAFLGFVMLLAARQQHTSEGPLSPTYVVAFLLLGVALVLTLVGKTRSQ